MNRHGSTWKEAAASPARRDEPAAVYAGALTALLGLLSLFGWFFGIEVLKRFGYSLPATNPSAACAFVIGGLALVLLQRRAAEPARRRLGYAGAALLISLGIVELVTLAWGWHLPLARWLWPEDVTGGVGPPTPIAVRTALSYVLTGAALLLLNVQTRRGRRPGELFSAATIVIALLALIGYSYGVVVYYRTSTYVPMSLPSAFAFLFLSVGTLLARPDRGAIAVIVSDTAAGVLARLLLPLTVFLPLILSVVRRTGTSAGWFSTDLGVALFATVFIVVFFGAIWYTTRLLFRSDLERKAAEEHVRQVNEELEQRVATRTAELHAVNEELRTASKAKDDFLSVLSHELRTPLTPALAAASYLAETCGTLPPLEFVGELDVIRRNIQLEARLIDDLLDLTRISRGKIELHCGHADAHPQVRAALEMATTGAEEKRLTISTALEATEDHLWADPIRLQQVFWNLINNAVKFTPVGGAIAITTANDEQGRFQFQITDTGIGIEPERKEALFKAFEQGERTVTRQFGGLGLGLTIAKTLVDLHDGTIAVESRGRGHGATFRVTLAVLRKQAQPETTRAPTRSASTSSLRILLVEDHDDTRRTISHLLTHYGHHVSAAESVGAARAILQSESFQAVLSDIGLPDGTGYDVIAEARRQQPEGVPAFTGIALTGFGMDEDVLRSKEAGFDFHLTKPIDFSELRAVLEQVVK